MKNERQDGSVFLCVRVRECVRMCLCIFSLFPSVDSVRYNRPSVA
jgi:hypothetical protein